MSPVPLSLLAAATSPANPVVLLLMKGHPGTGKSTLARSLAKTLRWPLVDKDVFRDATMPLERQDGPCATPVAARVLNNLSYDAMWQMTEIQLDLGLSVVVDCPLAHEALFQAGVALGTRVGAKVALIECHVSDLDTWKRRIESRAAAALRDDPTVDNAQESLDGCRPSDFRRSAGGTSQDGSGQKEKPDGRTPANQSEDKNRAKGQDGSGAATGFCSRDGCIPSTPIRRVSQMGMDGCGDVSVLGEDLRGERSQMQGEGVERQRGEENTQQERGERSQLQGEGVEKQRGEESLQQERGERSHMGMDGCGDVSVLSENLREERCQMGMDGCGDVSVLSEGFRGERSLMQGEGVEEQRGEESKQQWRGGEKKPGGVKPGGVKLGGVKGRWHKPACWEDMEEILARYNGCWTYPTGSVPKLSIDTGTMGPDEALARSLAWLESTLPAQ